MTSTLLNSIEKTVLNTFPSPISLRGTQFIAKFLRSSIARFGGWSRLEQSSFLFGITRHPAAAVQSVWDELPVIHILPRRIPTMAMAEVDNQISARPAGTGYRAKQIPRDRAHNFSLNVVTSLNGAPSERANGCRAAWVKRDYAGCIVPSVSGADFFVNFASRFRMHRA